MLFRSRAADICDVTKRVFANFLGKKLPNPASINEESVVIAHDLTPFDTAQLDKKFVKAFVTNIGGRTSHSAIMARTLEIAAVLGTNNITELVKDGDVIAANGITGEVIINPTENQISAFKAAGEAYAKQKAEWEFFSSHIYKFVHKKQVCFKPFSFSPFSSGKSWVKYW